MQSSICFISETSRKDRPILDPSVRYRCYHPAEFLQREGHHCAVYSGANFFEAPVYDHDVFVFHRPNTARPGFERTFNTLLRMGRTLIADYDDLIFGTEKIALGSSAVKNRTLSPETAIQSFASNLDAMRHFDKISVSTTPLGDMVKRFNRGAEVRISHNHLPVTMTRPHMEFGTPYRVRPKGTIGYFAGTNSHNRDFPIVEEVLHRVLLENADFSLLVVGPVSLPASLASLPNVVTAPPIGYWRLPYLMTLCNTVIAPLEDGEFNACKSRVKFLEAALAGCRLIASPIPDMEAIGGTRLVLARNKDEWYEALSAPETGEAELHRVEANLRFLEEERNLDGLKGLGGLT
jgi:hypothetical protein